MPPRKAWSCAVVWDGIRACENILTGHHGLMNVRARSTLVLWNGRGTCLGLVDQVRRDIPRKCNLVAPRRGRTGSLRRYIRKARYLYHMQVV